MLRLSIAFVLLCCIGTSARADNAPARREWKIDGVAREALVYAPASAKIADSPVIFVFHGHGGTMQQMAKKFACEKQWPEAICVYPQGLATLGTNDPDGKKPGWQHTTDEQNGRDLKFFDTMLGDLKTNYKVDEKRIYSTGFSNGAGFTFVLWEARGDVLAAVAPCSGGSERHLETIKPKPVMIATGEKDPLVKFDSQQRAIEALRKLNQVDHEGQKWTDLCISYSSKAGTPLVTYIHPGGHVVPDAVPPLIVKFFKEQAKK